MRAEKDALHNDRCYKVSKSDFEKVREASDVQHSNSLYRTLPLSFDFFLSVTWQSQI